MNAKAFFDLVTKMRESQKSYLKTRDYGDLQKMRNLELLVDGEIHRVKKVLSGEKSLFDNP